MKKKIKCNAKINLSLDILEKRNDGYHSVEMIMQSINLYDNISLEIKSGDNIHISSDKSYVPTDHTNLAYKAAKLFLNEIEKKADISIYIEKNIPVGAGMAGGSTDAAGVLNALNELYNYPVSNERLLEIGKSIGADVPFCMIGGCMLAEGIGEKLSPVKSLKNAFIVVAKPNFSVSTPWAYKNFDAYPTKKHPNTKAIISALEKGDISAISHNTFNVLEPVVSAKYPEISEYKNIMSEFDAVFTLMSGSGPTVFGVFTDKTLAQNATDLLKSKSDEVFIIEL